MENFVKVVDEHSTNISTNAFISDIRFNEQEDYMCVSFLETPVI